MCESVGVCVHMWVHTYGRDFMEKAQSPWQTVLSWSAQMRSLAEEVSPQTWMVFEEDSFKELVVISEVAGRSARSGCPRTFRERSRPCRLSCDISAAAAVWASRL